MDHALSLGLDQLLGCLDRLLGCLSGLGGLVGVDDMGYISLYGVTEEEAVLPTAPRSLGRTGSIRKATVPEGLDEFESGYGSGFVEVYGVEAIPGLFPPVGGLSEELDDSLAGLYALPR